MTHETPDWVGKVFVSVPGRRLRVRRCDPSDPVRAVARARAAGRPVITISHGGAVANGYGWPAETECRLEVAFPEGAFVSWSARAPANKVTYAGAADAAFRGSGDLFDQRVRRPERLRAARERVLQHAREVLAQRGTPAPELTVPGPEEIAPADVGAILDRVGPAGEQCRADERRYRLDRRYARTALVRSDGSAALIGYEGGDYAVLVVRDATSGERHILRVPPEAATRPGAPDDVIHAAVAWTFGLRPEEYHPDVAA